MCSRRLSALFIHINMRAVHNKYGSILMGTYNNSSVAAYIFRYIICCVHQINLSFISDYFSE